jgi:HD-GYP domain-containing protein (c-di-GMP phosphodiesterase class II)
VQSETTASTTLAPEPASPIGRVHARLFSADPDAAEGRWIAEMRERRSQGLGARDRQFSLAAVMGFVVFAVLSAIYIGSYRSASPFVILTIIGAYALAASVEFEVGAGSAVPTELVLVPMLFLVPLGLVPACVAVGLLLADVPRYVRREAHLARAVPLLMSAWYVAGPVIVLSAFGATEPNLSHWPIYVLALVSQFAIDFLVSTSRPWYAFGTPPLSQLSQMISAWAVDSALAPIGLFVAIVAADHRYAYLATVPLVLLMAVFARERQIRISNALELGHAYRGTALLLGDMIEADDQGTGAHNRDVVTLVIEVSKRMQLDERSRRHAEFAALLHDVGKVRVPKEIIDKPGKLTDVEWLVIKQHTVWGEEMLKNVGGILGEIGSIVRSCHERWDGGGYPDGLAGEQIPLIARIVLACDPFSAMTTDRSYRKARSTAEAVAELRRCSGTQFDPEVVEVLVEIISESEDLAPAARRGAHADRAGASGPAGGRLSCRRAVVGRRRGSESRERGRPRAARRAAPRRSAPSR